jgi:hypothetical protein
MKIIIKYEMESKKLKCMRKIYSERMHKLQKIV